LAARFLAVHRRLVASLAAMACVFALAVIAADRGEPRVDVVAAAGRVAAGHQLTAADLTTVAAPAGLVPDGALTEVGEAVGRMLAAALPRGAIVTADSLVAESGHAAGPGRLVLPVTVAQTDVLKLLRPGDEIALLIPDGPAGETVVADDALVVAVPDSAADGFLGSGGAAYVLVDVPNETAARLAGPATTSTVTNALR
jgi:Flp pilus assembly protein CpaB